MLIAVFIALQWLSNIVLDRSGLSARLFSSSGMFIWIVFAIVWTLLSAGIAEKMFPSFFCGDLWFFTALAPWLAVLVAGPFVLLCSQLLYSYVARPFILKKK